MNHLKADVNVFEEFAESSINGGYGGVCVKQLRNAYFYSCEALSSLGMKQLFKIFTQPNAEAHMSEHTHVPKPATAICLPSL